MVTMKVAEGPLAEPPGARDTMTVPAATPAPEMSVPGARALEGMPAVSVSVLPAIAPVIVATTTSAFGEPTTTTSPPCEMASAPPAPKAPPATGLGATSFETSTHAPPGSAAAKT